MAATARAVLGVIGGSGFYEIEGLTNPRELNLQTPYGPTSDSIVAGELAGVPVAFVSRHGAGHLLMPSEVPYRANVWALASLGVRSLISVSAVGSLREQIQPLHFVVPDQIIDRTTGNRPSTFFGSGIVAHVSLDQPYCPRLSRALAEGTATLGAEVHRGGTFIVIEGPAFSTKAESFLYREWRASIIGMTAMPEARLAREAGMCYSCLACITDYDTWHAEHGAVTVDIVLRNLQMCVETAKQAVAQVATRLPDWRDCSCCESLASAIITHPDAIPDPRRVDLAPILERYGP